VQSNEKLQVRARYGSDLIKQLYQKYGTKGLGIVLKSPSEAYNELTDLSSYTNKINKNPDALRYKTSSYP